MPQIVDLSQPYGGQGKYGQSFQAIANILDTIGKVERLRQERSLNSKIINAVSMGGGPQQIAQIIVENQPQYSTGPTGLLQQIAESFAPPSMIEGQYGGALTEAAIEQASPLYQARTKYYERGGRGGTGSTIDRLLRAAEISERQSKIAPSIGLAQKYREDARGFIKQAMDLMFPADTSETTQKQRKRATQIDQRIQKTETTKTTGVEPTTEDLEKYRRMGDKEYTSPSGKKYPLTKTISKSVAEPKKTGPEFTLSEMNDIIKAGTRGITRDKFYAEVKKLKDFWAELTKEEEITALNKLAEGFTADEIIEHLKSKPRKIP